MRYKYHYAALHNERLVDFLDAQQIRYHIMAGGDIVPTIVIFSLWSSASNTAMLMPHLAELGCRDPIVMIEYSRAELSCAELLVMRPKRQTIEITNADEAFSCSCEWVDAFGIHRCRHEWQTGVLMIAKEPPVNTRTALWSVDFGFAPVFADYRVRAMAEENDLVGVEFRNLLKRDGTYSKVLYQITSPDVIRREALSQGHGEKMLKCPFCGKEQYSIDAAYQLHLYYSRIKGNSDLYVTERIFGDGIAEPLYVVSQRFYRLLQQNKLAANVSFEPVANVEKR